MKHSTRCERAKGPICKCRCEGSQHGIAHVVSIIPSGTTTPITGRYMCQPMGGKVAEVITQFYNRKFVCPRGHTMKIHQFVGHPDGIGYPDRKNTRWQIYVKCPKCARDWPVWEIALKQSIASVPEPERVRFAVERYLEELETMWPAPEEIPQFEIREEKGCLLLIDTECFISRVGDTEVTVCGETVKVLGDCIEWVTGHEHIIEKIEKGDADVFKIEKA